MSTRTPSLALTELVGNHLTKRRGERRLRAVHAPIHDTPSPGGFRQAGDEPKQNQEPELNHRETRWSGEPFIYAVHAVRADEIRATEVVWSSQGNAEEYAGQLSTDPGVLAGAVTRFRVNSPGERKALAMYVSGTRQQVPHLSDDRRIAANGYITHPSLRRRR
ncbi:hypothetical protein [Pseudonocardia acaciae]|uniref:hypothetical protein n=1 Tax=Pseudonocardia acaciae TaxID=551276 RepID=UPI0012ED5EC8|nr:hypothetical protein [Pseudonocardia acaciae]